MEKRSIEEQIMVRILSDANKATEYLASLSDIIDDSILGIIDDETLYTGYPNLNEYISFLIEENFEFVNIDVINKILDDLKKLLIKRINIISKTNENFYELTILLLALENLSNRGTSAFKSDELIKNDRVQLCYNLAMLIVDNCRGEEQKIWFNENLKKLRFN